MRNTQWDVGTWLTDDTSRESVASANLLDLPHVAKELVELRFRVGRGRVGSSHIV